MRGLELTDPEITHAVGLVTPQTEPVHPIVRALLAELPALDIDGQINLG